MSNLYGYGAVDKDGNPWFDDFCVSEDREQLEYEVLALNANHEILGVDDEDEIKHVGFEPPAPYRVVTLYWDNQEPTQ